MDVGEPSFNLNKRYHCPVYGVSNFIKPKYKCFDRTTCIWKYDQGDYENLRRKIHVFDRNSISDNNVDKYADNLTEVLSNDAKLFIPNKMVTINPHEPPWITCNIKRKNRLRKRLCRKARLTGKEQHWSRFRSLRNGVTTLIRESKTNHVNKIKASLKLGNLTSRDWWKT